MSQPWLSHHPDGVASLLAETRPASLSTLFQCSVAEFATRPAFQQQGHTLSYQDAATQVDRLARFLQHQLGLAPGSRLALMMPNILAYPIALFAAFQAGLAIVNISPTASPRRLAAQLNDSGATGIILIEAASATLAHILAQTQIQHIVVANGHDLALNTTSDLPRSFSLNHALRLGASLPPTHADLGPHDLAVLQYADADGARGAMFSHANLLANVDQVCAWMRGPGQGNSETMVTALPLHQVCAQAINLFTLIALGGLNLLIGQPRDLDALCQPRQPLPIHIVSAEASGLQQLLNHPRLDQIDLSQLRFGFCDGKNMPASLYAQWQAATGVPLIAAYGLPAHHLVATLNPLDDRHKTGCIGLPLAGTDVHIRDATGRMLNGGEVGDLWLKGPQVMSGYWQRPDDAAWVVDAQGYAASGQRAFMDEEGYVTLVTATA